MATLFAIECRNRGQAIVLAARRELFAEVPRSGSNHADRLECAVNLGVSPTEFVRRSDVALEVDRAIEILRMLGFSRLPIRLSGQYQLDQALKDSQQEEDRLDLEQIRRFNQLMLEDGS